MAFGKIALPTSSFQTGVTSTAIASACTALENAKRNNPNPNATMQKIIAALEKKCAAEQATIATTASTLAAQTAVNQEVSNTSNTFNTQLVEASTRSASAASNKKSLFVGIGGSLLGTGIGLAAGLSTTIAIPVGVGFGVGSAVVTKILSMKKGV